VDGTQYPIPNSNSRFSKSQYPIINTNSQNPLPNSAKNIKNILNFRRRQKYEHFFTARDKILIETIEKLRMNDQTDSDRAVS
jgi:hypothetical protein